MPSFNFIQDKNLESKPLSAALYIISTPIGNIEDISLRALNTIAKLDYLYAEDPRVSLNLINFYNIKKSLRTYNDQTTLKIRNEIIELLKLGKSVGLMSDAGTPLISDPGYKLVRQLQENQLEIIAIPGACSAITALSCSALPTDNFHFMGFAPRKTAQIENLLNQISSLKGTYIFFETALRLEKFLQIIAAKLPNQEIFIARELTKKYEEKILANTNNIIDKISTMKLKGELVVIINNQISKKTLAIANDLHKILEVGSKYLSAKNLSKFLSEISNLKKNELYNIIIDKKSPEKSSNV